MGDPVQKFRNVTFKGIIPRDRVVFPERDFEMVFGLVAGEVTAFVAGRAADAIAGNPLARSDVFELHGKPGAAFEFKAKVLISDAEWGKSESQQRARKVFGLVPNPTKDDDVIDVVIP